MKILEGVLFLAARTARSQAYAQAMVNAGLYPETTLVFGKDKSGRLGQADKSPAKHSLPSIFVPNFTEPLEITCGRTGQNIEFIDAGSVRDDDIRARLEQLSPSLIVYSGYGGEIVPGDMCSVWRWLHLHSGWLPEYRGSTTTYYSLLEKNQCGVSAIFLAASIDTGPIIKRKSYPAPPKGTDIDYVYDSAVRADLLVNVLTDFSRSGVIQTMMMQDDDAGQTYYVIHPVLKNLVLMRLDRQTNHLTIPEIFLD